MKAKKQASEGTPFNDDDQRKQIMDYDLRVCTWNIRTLNRDGASAKLAKTLIKFGADIQEMRWIGQGYKIRKNCNIYYNSVAKNDAYKRTLQSAATRVIVEDYRQKRREERRLIRCKKSLQVRREPEEIEMDRSRNDVHKFSKTSRV